MNGHVNGFSHTADTLPSVPATSLISKCHPLVELISSKVHKYFLERWKFQNEKAKQKFLAADFPRVTCLYFPEARDDRIEYACRLLSLLFLIDGMLNYIGVDSRIDKFQICSRKCPSRRVLDTMND